MIDLTKQVVFEIVESVEQLIHFNINDMDYKQEIEYVKENSLCVEDDIFDFIGMLNDDEYQKFYDFCRENLNIQIERNNFPNACFIFTNNRDINARASKTATGHNIIYINCGLMGHCIKEYMFNHGLNDYVENVYPELFSKFDCSVSYLMYQLITQFCYYHELGHLFQFSRLKDEKDLQERTSGGKFELMKHKLETNADTLASIYMATHIDNYIQRILGKGLSEKDIIDIISISGASLLEYIMSFNGKNELYLKELSHPHSLIRMLNIVLNFVNHFSQIPIYKKMGISLEPTALYRKILDLHNKLVETKVFNNEVPTIKDSDIPSLMSYVEEIRNFEGVTEYTDAMSIWNKYVNN